LTKTNYSFLLHGKAIGIGEVLWDGARFEKEKTGKCVRSLYFVGDDVKDMLRLYAESSNMYHINHMNKIRESLKQNKQPRIMERQKRIIRINWEDERGFCGMKKGQAIISYDMCNDNCFTCAYVLLEPFFLSPN
jgi:hypothetical protein